ncbi:MAG: alpha/beta fold hydrolase [Chloroflexi bacterium]|nr:alpha/beta fold hydrolase [Chloroflexota bacterium]
MDITPFKDLYPFESRWLDLNGTRYHYVDEGPRDAPAVVMVHGNPTWSFYYRTLIPKISQTHRVVVPDHVGCGLSDKPQDYVYTLNQHVENLEALIAHLGLENVTLVLHDWGGAIGMGYATRHAENVARFVIFNTAAFFLPVVPMSLRFARSPVLGELVVRGLNGFAGTAQFLAVSHRERITPQVRAGYLAPYDNWRNRIAVYRFVQDIPLGKDHPSRPTLNDIENNLELFVHHPMLIIWGAKDFVFTERDFLPEWQRRFPDAQVRVLSDAGHYVVEDAHERILPWMLEFLEE